MMNQNNQNVSFEVVEELFQSLDKLLRNRKSGDQGARVVKEQSQPAIRPELGKKAPLKPRLERAPR
jgi:hypothetical protein